MRKRYQPFFASLVTSPELLVGYLVDVCPQQFTGTGDKKELATAFDIGDIEKIRKLEAAQSILHSRQEVKA